ncbi:60Kd inner membrane protein-domain-containing protein, partial [Polychytrium aggregatum]|uniref:60Kd inner membrane protein-domain-containing protein n=1 Tax=Polychytrium aggregatum TaxID=110093 RepID=UPI0022FE0E6E
TSEVTSAATASETVAAVAENAPIYIGYLKELGLSSLFPPGLVQSGIEAIAVTTGMPWYASIICATVAIRVAFFPLVVKTQRFAARMQNIKHLTDPVNAEITEARADKNMAKQMEATRRLQKIYKDHGINPLTSLLGLAQVPVFISFFLGIRDMCNLPVPSFRTGGAYWFTDLTVEDPTQILPMLATAGIITSFGAASATGATPVSTPLIIGISVVSLLAYGVTKSFPMGIFIYWVTSSVLTIIQTLVLQNNAIRAVLNIPPITRPASSSTTTSGSLSTLGSVKLLQSAKAQQKNIEAAKRIKASSQAAQPRKRS